MTKSEKALIADLINFTEAARRLDISHQSLRNALEDGRIPPNACVFIPAVNHQVLRWSKIKDLDILLYRKNHLKTSEALK